MLSRLGFLGVLLALTRSISLFGLLLALLWLEARQQAFGRALKEQVQELGIRNQLVRDSTGESFFGTNYSILNANSISYRYDGRPRRIFFQHAVELP